jgi:hypothetical protein
MKDKGFRSIITGEENWGNICEFLMVDKKNPKIYYCGLAKKEIDVALNPCVLPAPDRIVLCPLYRNYWVKTSMKKA